MIWHDGDGFVGANDLSRHRLQIVSDNLVDRGAIPPMVHLLVSPSRPGEALDLQYPGQTPQAAMRSLQYDTVSPRYGLHLLREVIPNAQQHVRLRHDGYSRGTAGLSSGGLCAFKLAWFQPGEFTRAMSGIGSFTGLRWASGDDEAGGFMLSNHVRVDPKRNIRVWLSEGMNDIEVDESGRSDLLRAGSWPLNNIQLANALKIRGYDFHFRYGNGHHTTAQTAVDLPHALTWLWRDYDPAREEQLFEQEERERQQPIFRVAISNRDGS